MEKSDRKILITSAILGILLSFPVTGFIYGFYSCEDYNNGITSLLGRIFTGFVEAILTTITLGAPWNNEGGTSSTNLRFYVFLSALFITFLFFKIQKRKENRQSKN